MNYDYTINDIDGLIERLCSARSGADISGEDIILTLNILNEVRSNRLENGDDAISQQGHSPHREQNTTERMA